MPVDLDCAIDVHLNDGNFACGLDAVKLSEARAIVLALSSLTVFNELSVLHHSHELILRNEVEIFDGFLVVGAVVPSCIRLFTVKDVTVLLKDQIDQGAFTDARWSNKDQWLIFEGCRVEWVEIFLGIDEDIIL